MLEDSSFAIHPERSSQEEPVKFFNIGAIVSWKQVDTGVICTCENGEAGVFLYEENLVRVMVNPWETLRLNDSPAVCDELKAASFSIEKNEKSLLLRAAHITVDISFSRFAVTVLDQTGAIITKDSEQGTFFSKRGEVITYRDIDEQAGVYGLGEKTGVLNKRERRWTMWNSDVFAPHNPETDPLYQSIPFFLVKGASRAYGVFFDNSSKTIFDFKEDLQYSMYAERGQLDYYIFHGPNPKDVISQYTKLTGKMPLPPKWALGYHQSRYSYKDEQEVRELVNTFKEKEIPLDTVYLDIHYMDGYRVFTFDKERFFDPKKLITDLQKQGIRVVTIVDPGVKVDPEYQPYLEGVQKGYFCKYADGTIYYGDVWPGKSAFPDFTNAAVRKWWGTLHEFYTELGVSGIWNDMNEPAVFNKTKTMDIDVLHDNDGNAKTHRELHNLYGLYMGKATYEGLASLMKEERPFLLTRAGYAGVQRYAAVWTGDNRSFWEHLQLAIPMCLNLGVSGVAFCGADVGGFEFDATGELLVRWTQVGAFLPYFRNHCGINAVHQEPWSFGAKYEGMIKEAIERRYKWLPHLYSLFANSSKTGLPIIRPLWLEYPSDQQVVNLNDQFMLGSNVLIAPIVTPSTTHRAVYFPKGQWIDYHTEQVIEGGRYHLIEAALHVIPIFVRVGSIIPHGQPKFSTLEKDTTLTLHLYPTEKHMTTEVIYEDDGETTAYHSGAFCLMNVSCRVKESILYIDAYKEGAFTPSWEELEFVIHFSTKVGKVVINDQEAVTHTEKGLPTYKLNIKQI